jgi:hypothetical protein
MPSPFPGMDPYLESPVYWQDFHSTFIGALREQIADVLPGQYFAKIEEELVLLEPGEDDRYARSDVLVGREGRSTKTSSTGGAAVAEIEPATLHNITNYDPETHVYIEIRRLPTREVVTVVEVLSPTNKQGEGRGVYLDRRGQLLRREINVVDLDLLRAGKRIVLKEQLPPGHYYALVSRVDRKPECQVYSRTIRQALPTIAIPLKSPDSDVRVNIGEAFRVAYQRGRYAQMVNYNEPAPAAGLNGDEMEWVSQVVRRPPGAQMGG